jgi:hypothetical protein
VNDDITDRIPTAFSAAAISEDPACKHCLEQFFCWMNDNHFEEPTPDETAAAWRIWAGAFVSGHVAGAARIRAKYGPKIEFVHIG